MKIKSFFALLAVMTAFLSTSCDSEVSTPQTPPAPTDTTEVDSSAYVIAKWKSDGAVYVMRRNGYMMYSEDGTPHADALVNDEYFGFDFDEEGRLRDMRGALLNIHVAYGDMNDDACCDTLYGNCYGTAFVIYDRDDDAKSQRRREGSSADVLGKWFMGKVKTALVTKGINKALDIERNPHGTLDEALRSKALRGTVRELMGMAGQMNSYLDYKDMTALELVHKVESEYPDLGGVEYLVGGVSEFGSFTPSEGLTLNLLMKWIKDLQDRNKRISQERASREEEAIVLFGMDTWCYPDVNSCEVGIGGELSAIAGKEDRTFEYGICLTPSDAVGEGKEHWRPIGSFTVGESLQQITVRLPSSVIVDNLEPQTTYTCRAYCRSLGDGSVICEDGHDFTTLGTLDENTAFLQVTSAKYFSGDDDVFFSGTSVVEKPRLDNVEDWGIYVDHEGTKSNGRAYYGHNENADATLHRDKFQVVDAARHYASGEVNVGTWAQVSGEKSRRVSAPKAQQVVYDSPVSVTITGVTQSGDTYPATTSVGDENGGWHTATCVGLTWYPWSVTFHVSGALFMDCMGIACNQYAYGLKPENQNGLIYSELVGEWYTYYQDGEMTESVRQLTCPTGSYSVEGKSYSQTSYLENWEWPVYKCNGKIGFSTNAIHYINSRKPGISIEGSYKDEQKVWLQNNK